MVLQGGRDEVTLEHSVAVAAALPQGRLAVLPGTPTWASTSRSLGPTYTAVSPAASATHGSAATACRNRSWTSAGAASSISRAPLRRASTKATTISSSPMTRLATASYTADPMARCSSSAARARASPTSAAESSRNTVEGIGSEEVATCNTATPTATLVTGSGWRRLCTPS